MIYSYSDGDIGIVYIVRHGKYEILITTQQDWVACGLCYTRSGNILVYMKKTMTLIKGMQKIVRYMGQRLKQQIIYGKHGNTIFMFGFDLIICQRTTMKTHGFQITTPTSWLYWTRREVFDMTVNRSGESIPLTLDIQCQMI